MVAPLVLYLCAEQCPSSGRVYQAGLKLFNRAAVVSGPGIRIGDREIELSPETIAARWSKITSLEGAREYPDAIRAIFDMASELLNSNPVDEQSQPQVAEKASHDPQRRKQ